MIYVTSKMLNGLRISYLSKREKTKIKPKKLISLTIIFSCSGYHSLYRCHQSMFHRHLPVQIAFQDSIKRWTFGLYPACIKYVMSAFDVPEVRNNNFRDTIYLFIIIKMAYCN